MESFIREFEVDIVDHAATDGIGTLLRSFIDELEEDQYSAYLRYIKESCREKSILGLSNHGLLICRKR
jgi:hypothetical protein